MAWLQPQYGQCKVTCDDIGKCCLFLVRTKWCLLTTAGHIYIYWGQYCRAYSWRLVTMAEQTQIVLVHYGKSCTRRTWSQLYDIYRKMNGGWPPEYVEQAVTKCSKRGGLPTRGRAARWHNTNVKKLYTYNALEVAQYKTLGGLWWHALKAS